ncbi:hypothetical protein RchiOBHm_Chr2g0090871 [Rosa chinensis]|uniref:Uncharacterized protein n=1 Tax=Rosa chinensis TaxID=74649 RepID=A0A2P6RJJ4_ROSCH|nr:hypothetical protein RchiOBHm_Chr2g0090871 [Rosa chinensis]
MTERWHAQVRRWLCLFKSWCGVNAWSRSRSTAFAEGGDWLVIGLGRLQCRQKHKLLVGVMAAVVWRLGRPPN